MERQCSESVLRHSRDLSSSRRPQSVRQQLKSRSWHWWVCLELTHVWLSLSLPPSIGQTWAWDVWFFTFCSGTNITGGSFFLLSHRCSEVEDDVPAGLTLPAPTTTATPVCDLVKTAHASFKDLRGAVAPAHRHPGGSDCGPTAATHTHPHGGHKDVSPNQVLHGTRGLGAVSERNQLQLRGGDVLCLAGEPQ